MRLRFWKRETLVEGPKLSAECEHVWSNWGEPVEREMVRESIFLGASGTRSTLVQTRRCMLCNLHERALS